MPVAFDNTIATVLFNRRAEIPTDPNASGPIHLARERVEALVERLHKDKLKIIMATPVIAELLTVSGPEGTQYFDIITKAKQFQVADFDIRAALEVSFMNAVALAAGDKKAGIDAPWQKIKVDRQIIAICRVNNVNVLYTDDDNLAKTAQRVGITTVALHELPLPDTARQGNIFTYVEFGQTEETPDAGEA